MSDTTPRLLRSGIVPKKLSLPKSDEIKLKLKSPLETLFKRKVKNQGTQTDPELDPETDTSSESGSSEKSFVIKTPKMSSIKLENVPIFDGVYSKLKQFVELIDVIYELEDGKDNDKIFAKAIFYLRLSESVRNKINVNFESWKQLKELLENQFKHDPTISFKKATKFNQLAIMETETLSQFVDRLIDNLEAIRSSSESEQNLWRLAEEQAIEKVKEYCPRNSRIILGNPSSLEEAKFVLETKGIGQSKVTKNFKTVEELARLEWQSEPDSSQNCWGAPIQQNFKNNYRPQGNFRYNNQNNFQGNSSYFPRYQNQRYHDQRYQNHRYQDPGYQFQRYQNPRYENSNFRNNFNHNNNHNHNNHNNQNFRPPNQNSYRNYNNQNQNGNSFRQNYPNGRNFQNNVMNTQSFPAIMPNSENPETVQFIDKKEYEEFLQFKLQKNL